MTQHKLLGLPLGLVLGLFLVGVTHTLGQAVSGTLLGTVSDSSGAAVVGAQVTATMPSTGISHVSQTNGSGNYTFPNMPPGLYTITVNAKGFAKAEQDNIGLLANTSPRADFKLQPGNVTQTVVVDTAPPMLQTDRADISSNIDASSVEDLPLTSNRNFQGLINLVPGAVPAVFAHSQFYNAQDSMTAEVDGIPLEFNLLEIEGMSDNDSQGLLQVLIPPAAAIQNVQITTNDYEASLGTAVGAITNVTLKSGTNQLHGSAYEFIQNNAADATPVFSGPLGHLSYNYFGGSIGGPILKDKLFFFGDFVRDMDSEAVTNTLTIPDSRWYTNAGVTPGCTDPAGCIDLSGAYGGTSSSGVKTGQIYDPATGNGTAASPRTPFPNNQIPYSRINPVSLTILKDIVAAAPTYGALNSTLPLSNPANNYIANDPFDKDADSFDTKFDYQPNESNHLSFRYSYQYVTISYAALFGKFLGGPGDTGIEGPGNSHTFSTGVTYDHIFSPSFFTEVRVGATHMHNVSDPSDYGSDDATTLGVPGVNVPGDPLTSGQVAVIIDDFPADVSSGSLSSTTPLIGYAWDVPWERASLNAELANNWTKVVGNHTITWGGQIFRLHNDLLQLNSNLRGQYEFLDAQTSNVGATDNDANDMASFLLDQPYAVSRGLAETLPTGRSWWFAAFVGDKWQTSSKLTLDYGVRWENYRSPTPNKPGGYSVFNPTNNTLEIGGYGSIAMNEGVINDFKYFAPRIGISYRVTNNTVVRTGYGITFTDNANIAERDDYPIETSNTYTPTGTSSYTPAVLTSGATATFQEGFPAPAYPAVPADGIIQANSAFLISSSETAINYSLRNPYVQSYNLAVEHSFGANYSLQIAYVGNYGSRFPISYNINSPTTYGVGTTSEPENSTAYTGGATGRTASTSWDLPTSEYYDGLQAQLTKRFSSGFSFTSAFTFGKGYGYGTGQNDNGGGPFTLDYRKNFSVDDFSRTRNFEQSLIYELPAGRGHRYFNSPLGDAFLGKWRLSAMISLVSGLPFTVLANSAALDTTGDDLTANISGRLKVAHGIGAGRQWFETSSFSQPAGCTATPCTNPVLGNTGRNQFWGPGYVMDNFSLAKDFPTYRELSTEIRLDAVDLSNTPQYSNPDSTLTDSTFGQVTSLDSSGQGAVNGLDGARTLQASVKFTF